MSLAVQVFDRTAKNAPFKGGFLKPPAMLVAFDCAPPYGG